MHPARNHNEGNPSLKRNHIESRNSIEEDIAWLDPCCSHWAVGPRRPQGILIDLPNLVRVESIGLIPCEYSVFLSPKAVMGRLGRSAL